jgi:acetyltransferase
MATDALVAGGGTLAHLSQETVQKLNAVLPDSWSRGNPVDIIGDAPAERYVAALKILLEDPQSDAVLLIDAPTAIVPSVQIAEACAPLIRGAQRNVLASWLGGEGVRQADTIFTAAGIPTYPTPEEAVCAFLQLVNYRRNQVVS